MPCRVCNTRIECRGSYDHGDAHTRIEDLLTWVACAISQGYVPPTDAKLAEKAEQDSAKKLRDAG
eukprot:2623821-Rhodomonas_salina.1